MRAREKTTQSLNFTHNLLQGSYVYVCYKKSLAILFLAGANLKKSFTEHYFSCGEFFQLAQFCRNTSHNSDSHIFFTSYPF